MRRLTIAIALGLMALAMFAAPASATVHEIVGQRCSGKPGINPLGISGGSNADNFAQPLFSNGFILGIVPTEGDGVHGPGLLVQFNFDHPASKIVPTGAPKFEEYLPPDGTPLYVDGHTVDLDHPHANCKNLR